ncbi:MAG: cysteine methyltransferase [Pirellula sp.]|nr:cysteine methyltransferase [Pirellula sp.]
MSDATYFSELDSPVGRLYLRGDGRFLTGLYLPQHKHWTGPEAGCERRDESFSAVRSQLDEYFAGRRQTFDVPIKLAGTPFQLRVWQQLAEIPFGRTISYAELARRVGNPTASRAVGNANGRNPISIIIPCHRVVGVDGKLTGYAGGVAKKQRLLAWESARLHDAAAPAFEELTA